MSCYWCSEVPLQGGEIRPPVRSCGIVLGVTRMQNDKRVSNCIHGSGGKDRFALRQEYIDTLFTRK